ncbi:MAG: NAD-dependent epimerase/dehydratase family protein [bacterium]|nr:NAD-dependent epimerase/dehydratase family protein [bacterium]
MKFWKNKKVLVVGGAGFIGSHTVDALLAYKAKIVVVDHLSARKKYSRDVRAKYYNLDAASSRLAHIFIKEKPEYVFMFAALNNIPLSRERPSLDAASILGLLNVLENCVRYRAKKILYSSSGFIYGNTLKLPTPEGSPLSADSPYNISKIASENYLKFFHSYYSLPYVILRYGTVYGPRQTAGAIRGYIQKIYRNERAEIYGGKSRDCIYVKDVAEANIAAMEQDVKNAEPIFNIATGKEIKLTAVYKIITRVLGRPDNHPILLPARAGEIDRFCLDVRKAKRVLGFSPRVSLERGLTETVQWFLKNQK